MLNQKTRLLNASELMDLYGQPILNENERKEYFTFNKEETQNLYSFKFIEDAVYFAISLVFFKLKQTLIDFNYREVTPERQLVVTRYFPNSKSPKSLPNNKNRIARIENKVLALCGYQRVGDDLVDSIKEDLFQCAPEHPRQRQLCKALLDLFVKHQIAIPSYTTIQSLVSEIWNKENNRVLQTYQRHTNKSQRESILSLLNKTDDLHQFISIKQEMKAFNTTEINKEIEKHHQLKPIFELAEVIIPKLRLPVTTLNYYASLIHYYNGPRLKQLGELSIQLYLMCYCFTRFQKLNDNLLEALKKRTLEYQMKAKEFAKNKALNQLDLIKEVRQKVSNLLLAIKQHPDPEKIPKKVLYQYVPEDELHTAAKLLVDNNFDKNQSFWKYIDSVESSIKLNLRSLFLTIDFVVTHDDVLNEVIEHVKTSLRNKTSSHSPLPQNIQAWLQRNGDEYIIKNGAIFYNRFEFFLYKRIVHHMTTNKLTLKHSIKYKRIEDDLMPLSKWHKRKSKILKTLGYDKLKAPLRKTLKNKQKELTKLYHTVNQSILNGENEQIKLTKNKNNEQIWRLRPLEEMSDPNEGLFASFQQRSIVDIIQFVSGKTNFTKAFEPILPRSTRNKQDNELIMAVVLANAIRLGSRRMANISDFKKSELLTAEASYVRKETLMAATDMVNNAAAQFPIYKKWYINSVMHASLDGLKLETDLRHMNARHSKKYFGRGIGVSGYNEIFNCFSLASRLIGTNEYEGHFTFEMVHHQNTSEIKPSHISTDKHGTNAVNFGLFDLTDLVFAPRIPKPHNETFWGFGSEEDYKDNYIIKPTKFVDEDFLISEWDNIQHLVSSLLTGDTAPNILVRKLSSNNYQSNTKKAFAQYSSIVHSQFLLKNLHEPEFRRAILIALNRGEAFNNLYRAITILRKGELRGQTEIEMENWDQCTRLISSIILYYNTYILNSLYQNSHDPAEREFLLGLSPGAWVHITLLGYYQFCNEFNSEWVDSWIKKWDWRKNV